MAFRKGGCLKIVLRPRDQVALISPLAGKAQIRLLLRIIYANVRRSCWSFWIAMRRQTSPTLLGKLGADMDEVAPAKFARTFACLVICTLVFAVPLAVADASAQTAVLSESQSTISVGTSIIAVFNEISFAFTSFFDWFWNQGVIFKFQSIGINQPQSPLNRLRKVGRTITRPRLKAAHRAAEGMRRTPKSTREQIVYQCVAL